MKNHYNIPIFISHFGCPNDCAFCNQRKINGNETDITSEDIIKIVEEHLEFLPKEAIKEVAFFGGTFTGISKDLQREYLESVKPYIKEGRVDGIRLSTRPDYIDDEILKMLKEYSVTTIELGVQSFDNEVLKGNDRGYLRESIYKASTLIKNYNIALGIQLMPGLYKSNEENDLLGAKETIKIDPEVVRIYPTLVIKDTKLETLYKKGEYKPLTLEEAIDRTLKILVPLELKNINVIRVGLQPSEELDSGEGVIDGPYHPAFRDLVEGEIYKRFLMEKISNNETEVRVSERSISKVVGNKGVNKKHFKDKVKFIVDKSVEKDNLIVDGKEYTREDILQEVIR